MTRMTKSTCMTVALAVASLSLPVHAQQISEARIQDLIRVAAERVASGQAAAPGGQAPAPAVVDTRPVVRLTLDDVVKFALDRNLDIAVQRLNPQINDIAISSARAIYIPVLGSTLATQSTTTASTTNISGGAAGAPVIAGLTQYNGTIAQSVPWGGGNFLGTLNNNKATTTNNTAFYNPTFNSTWTFQFTQPVLRNFHIDSTRQTLRVAILTRDISDVQLRALITNTLSNVRNAYWDYVFSVQAVEVARQSVTLAGKLVDDNQTRVQVGTMAPLAVVTAQAQAAVAQQALVLAIGTQRANELALKRLIVSGTNDPNWGAQIDPTDRPDFQPEAIDIDAAVRRALSQRTDLDITKKSIESNDVTLRYLKDQTLPQADVVANYGLNGVGGTILKTGLGSYGDTWSSLFGANNPRWTVQMNFSYPLGLNAARASVARAQVQLSQVQAQLSQQQLQVATEVTNAAINAQSGAEAVTAAIASRVLSQRQLDAEQSKFEVGMSTNYFVVQAQNNLATAQNSELRAILNYRKALVELERLQQTTLQNLNITVVGR